MILLVYTSLFHTSILTIAPFLGQNYLKIELLNSIFIFLNFELNTIWFSEHFLCKLIDTLQEFNEFNVIDFSCISIQCKNKK